MEITYLGHSGFLAETSDAYYLFDYIRGELPAFSGDKRLYVFASHAHHDHWDPDIFTDKRLKDAACFILGFDIQEPFSQMKRKGSVPADLPVLWAFPQQIIRTEDLGLSSWTSAGSNLVRSTCFSSGAVGTSSTVPSR